MCLRSSETRLKEKSQKMTKYKSPVNDNYSSHNLISFHLLSLLSISFLFFPFHLFFFPFHFFLDNNNDNLFFFLSSRSSFVPFILFYFPCCYWWWSCWYCCFPALPSPFSQSATLATVVSRPRTQNKTIPNNFTSPYIYHRPKK